MPDKRRKKSSRSSLPRRCRASQDRFKESVQRAVSTWCEIFDKDQIIVDYPNGTCSELAKMIKLFISDPPCPCLEEERFAFQSIKKLLPPSCECMEFGMIDKVKDKLSSRPIDLPEGYLRFVEQESNRFFYKGWDKSYSRHCFTTTPPIKACIENSRAKGGSMAIGANQVDFLDRVLTGEGYSGMDVEAEAMVVQSAGKPRPLSKFSAEMLVLRPLHKCMYDRMSETSWLCRGDVTDARLKTAGFRRDLGILVSGDYASATDNLSIEVAELILTVARRKALHVPDGIWELALSALRPTLFSSYTEDERRRAEKRGESLPERKWEVDVSRGQMMGSFLSFPLLCFQNFLGFRWTQKSRGNGWMPLLINGDDILYQCSDEGFSSAWMDTVGSIGLEVERSKTSIAYDFGSLNSTLLRWSGDALVVVPTLRFGMLRQAEFPQGLGRSFYSFCGKIEDVDVKWRAARAFFRWHLKSLRSTRLTLDELGFRGTLARRLAGIFNLLPTDILILEAPVTPSPHNVRVHPNLVVKITKRSAGPELSEINSYMMSAWKWNHLFQPTSTAIQYALEMSKIRRPPGPRFCDLPMSRQSKVTGRAIKRRFCRQSEEGTEMLFVELLATQQFEACSLPPYDGEEWEDEKGSLLEGTDLALVEKVERCADRRGANYIDGPCPGYTSISE